MQMICQENIEQDFGLIAQPRFVSSLFWSLGLRFLSPNGQMMPGQMSKIFPLLYHGEVYISKYQAPTTPRSDV